MSNEGKASSLVLLADCSMAGFLISWRYKKKKKKKGISPDLHCLRQSRKIFEKCLKKTKFRRGLSATSSSVRGPNSEIPFYDMT